MKRYPCSSETGALEWIIKATEVVLLDFDMTMVDSSEGVAVCLMQLAEAYSLRKPGRDEVFTTIGLPMPEAMRKIWGCYDPEWLEYYRKHLSPVEQGYLEPLPGADRLLRLLRETGIPCGVVSNRRFLKSLIGELGWACFFDTVTVLGDGIAPKPDPAGLLAAMSRMAADKDRTIYIGDSTIDVEAALRAGIPCLAVTTGPSKRDALRETGAKAVFSSCKEIAEMFEEHRAEGARKGNE